MLVVRKEIKQKNKETILYFLDKLAKKYGERELQAIAYDRFDKKERAESTQIEMIPKKRGIAKGVTPEELMRFCINWNVAYIKSVNQVWEVVNNEDGEIQETIIPDGYSDTEWKKKKLNQWELDIL